MRESQRGGRVPLSVARERSGFVKHIGFRDGEPATKNGPIGIGLELAPRVHRGLKSS